MTMSKMIVFAFAVMCLSYGALAAVPPSLFIVGGQNAAKGQFPYQVSVRDSRNINYYNHLCGGVIIGYAEILTAAHCVSDIPAQKLYVVAGTTGLSPSSAGSVSINALQVIVHEFYRPGSYGNDIAFIRLAKKLPENRNDVRPLSLLRDLPKEGSECTVTGWGDINGTYAPTISQDLRFAKVSFVSNSECKKQYLYLQTDGICATGAGKIVGPCGQWDGGDPLACGNGLLGLFSWSDSCAPGVPGAYTAIPFHIFWITEKVKQGQGTTVKPTTKGTTKKPTTKGTSKKPTTKGTSKKPTTKGTSKKPTTKGTSKKPTTKGTTKKTTIQGTTKKTTTKGTTKKTTTKGTTKKTTIKGTTKGTTRPTIKTTTRRPNGARSNSVNFFVVISAVILVFLS